MAESVRSPPARPDPPPRALDRGRDGRAPEGDGHGRAESAHAAGRVRAWSTARPRSGGRGRPTHSYQASAEAHKRLGQNYADLALVLWDEMMNSVEDRKLRRFLFGRITDRMAEMYRAQITGDAWEGRLVQLGTILNDRGIEAEVTSQADALPILKQHSCPYFELAETDRAVCAMERKMFEKVLGRGLRLSQCRLDGHRSCDFEAKPLPAQAG